MIALWVALAVVVWLALGVAGMGIAFAYFTGKYPEQQHKHDPWVLALAGPINLMGVLPVTGIKYGIRFRLKGDSDGPREAPEDHRSGTDAAGDTNIRTSASGVTVSGASTGVNYDDYVAQLLGYGARYGGAALSAPIPEGIPTEQTMDAIQAWKIARLYTPDGRTVKLGAVHQPTDHPIEGTAICYRSHDSMMAMYFAVSSGRQSFTSPSTHFTPSLDCQCGFYAWKTTQGAHEYMKGIPDGYVLMQVELFGRVIQHENGYRAQSQRVLGVQVPSTCSGLLCGQPATCLEFLAHGREAPYKVLCAAHRPALSLSVVGVADIANALGCEVTWASA